MTWAYVYFSLVLVMKIGMCNLVIFQLLQGFKTLQFLTSHDVTSGIRTRGNVWRFVCFLDYRLTKKLIGAPLF